MFWIYCVHLRERQCSENLFHAVIKRKQGEEMFAVLFKYLQLLLAICSSFSMWNPLLCWKYDYDPQVGHILHQSQVFSLEY